MSAARPTRRAVVRSAAWSVPVVAIAATAPAFAASSPARMSFTDTPVKWGTGNAPKHVSWDVVLTNGVTRTITSVALTFTYRRANLDPYQGLSFEIYNIDPTLTPSPWSAPTVSTNGGTASSSSTQSIAPGGSITIHTDFSGSDNSTGDVKVDALITYSDGSTGTASIPVTGVTQSQGSTEPLPHSLH